jgi:hypothetical protein
MLGMDSLLQDKAREPIFQQQFFDFGVSLLGQQRDRS